MKKNIYDIDDYCGWFLMSRIAIKHFIDAGLFSNNQINKVDTFFESKTIKCKENIYNINSLVKEEYDPIVFWFLYRISIDAIKRLGLTKYITVDE